MFVETTLRNEHSIIIHIKKKWLLWIYYLTLNTTSWDFFHCDFSSWNIHICIWWLPKIKVSWIGNQVLHYLISRLNGYLELQLWSCCVTPSCHKKALFSRLISILHHHLLILKTSRKQNWGTINQNPHKSDALCNTYMCRYSIFRSVFHWTQYGLVGWILFFRNVNFWLES